MPNIALEGVEAALKSMPVVFDIHSKTYGTLTCSVGVFTKPHCKVIEMMPTCCPLHTNAPPASP